MATRPTGRRTARRAWIPALIGAVLTALWPMACTSVDNLVAPSCTFSMSPASASYGGSGGSGSFAVTAGDVCQWSAQSSASWITITAGATGKGNGKVSYSVLANDVTTPRSASVTVGTDTSTGTGFSISQSSASCTYAVSPTFASFPGDGGGGAVSVGTAPGCQWSASTGVSWITITSGSSGSGNGSVSFTVAPNSGSATRQGSLTVAGQSVGVNEAPPSPNCSFAASPQSASYDASGGTGTVSVAASNGCAWSASSDSSWITITSGAVGTGNGSVHYSVAADAGGARTGTLSVAGIAVSISQSTTCTVSLKPTSASYNSVGGIGTVAVTAGAGCAWTATENADWVAITGGSSGAGNGSVSYTVALNGTGKDRSATLTIGGVDFSIAQTATLHAQAIRLSPGPLLAPGSPELISTRSVPDRKG